MDRSCKRIWLKRSLPSSHCFACCHLRELLPMWQSQRHSSFTASSVLLKLLETSAEAQFLFVSEKASSLSKTKKDIAGWLSSISILEFSSERVDVLKLFFQKRSMSGNDALRTQGTPPNMAARLTLVILLTFVGWAIPQLLAIIGVFSSVFCVTWTWGFNLSLKRVCFWWWIGCEAQTFTN